MGVQWTTQVPSACSGPYLGPQCEGSKIAASLRPSRDTQKGLALNERGGVGLGGPLCWKRMMCQLCDPVCPEKEINNE